MKGSRYGKKKRFLDYDQSSFLAQDNLSFPGTHFTILRNNNLAYLIKTRGKRTAFMESNSLQRAHTGRCGVGGS